MVFNGRFGCGSKSTFPGFFPQLSAHFACNVSAHMSSLLFSLLQTPTSSSQRRQRFPNYRVPLPAIFCIKFPFKHIPSLLVSNCSTCLIRKKQPRLPQLLLRLSQTSIDTEKSSPHLSNGTRLYSAMHYTSCIYGRGPGTAKLSKRASTSFSLRTRHPKIKSPTKIQRVSRPSSPPTATTKQAHQTRSRTGVQPNERERRHGHPKRKGRGVLSSRSLKQKA